MHGVAVRDRRDAAGAVAAALAQQTGRRSRQTRDAGTGIGARAAHTDGHRHAAAGQQAGDRRALQPIAARRLAQVGGVDDERGAIGHRGGLAHRAVDRDMTPDQAAQHRRPGRIDTDLECVHVVGGGRAVRGDADRLIEHQQRGHVDRILRRLGAVTLGAIDLDAAQGAGQRLALLTIDFADAATRDVHQQNAWHTTTAVRAGGEYALGATTTVRVGAAIDPSPAPAGTLSPVAPDGLRWSLTAGGSTRVARGVMIDDFAEYLRVAARTTTSVETMPARYQGWAVLFGAGVRWGARGR
mgnify:CR=1 FL=1